jgi:hypothetical protein
MYGHKRLDVNRLVVEQRKELVVKPMNQTISEALLERPTEFNAIGFGVTGVNECN